MSRPGAVAGGESPGLHRARQYQELLETVFLPGGERLAVGGNNYPDRGGDHRAGGWGHPGVRLAVILQGTAEPPGRLAGRPGPPTAGALDLLDTFSSLSINKKW